MLSYRYDVILNPHNFPPQKKKNKYEMYYALFNPLIPRLFPIIFFFSSPIPWYSGIPSLASFFFKNYLLKCHSNLWVACYLPPRGGDKGANTTGLTVRSSTKKKYSLYMYLFVKKVLDKSKKNKYTSR